jgi:LysM repeat protein
VSIGFARQQDAETAAFNTNPQVDSLLAYAKQHIGSPYRMGGTTPQAFDCSGFTSFVYRNFGYNLERVSANQINNGKRIDKKEHLMPGDLVFFQGRNIKNSRIGHVGIVVESNPDGNFTFIHAGIKAGVAIASGSTPYYSARYVAGCRVINPESTTQYAESKPIETKSVEAKPVEKWVTTTKNITHTVRQGESLYAISKRYGISLADLKKWNSLSSNNIQIGQKLKLKQTRKERVKEEQPKEEQLAVEQQIKTEESTNKSIVHEVAKGETLFSLSVRYSCKVEEIMQWNDLLSTTISVGQKLNINNITIN